MSFIWRKGVAEDEDENDGVLHSTLLTGKVLKTKKLNVGERTAEGKHK